jgi:uncharacterized protein YndB with AHSA1/START domain
MSGKRKIKLTVEPGKPTIVIEREFDAPRRLVYQAVTQPELVKRWWGCPMGGGLTVCEMDVRVGGRWRYVMRGQDGNEHVFRGVYREIVPEEKVVQTSQYMEYPEALETITLEERDGKTTLRTVVLHQSVEGRDAHVASGMESGANASFDRLEEVVRSIS